MKKTLIPVLKSIILDLYKKIRPRKSSTGGTDKSRYCYSVWLRHLIHAHQSGLKEIPQNIAELGPGDSIGLGLAGLLSGAEKYYALDVVKYWDKDRNINIFDELIELFKKREPVPADAEFPNVKPGLDNYEFPDHILTDEVLNKALNENRLKTIREELKNIDQSSTNKHVSVYVPWDDDSVIDEESIDFIYSQAVLEHVEDLEKTYLLMNKWLKPDGMSSHMIDFKSHDITKAWDGHWAFSDFEWKILKRNKPFLINRASFSDHLKFHKKNQFSVVNQIPFKRTPSLSKSDLAKRYKHFSDEERTTSDLFVQSFKW